MAKRLTTHAAGGTQDLFTEGPFIMTQFFKKEPGWRIEAQADESVAWYVNDSITEFLASRGLTADLHALHEDVAEMLVDYLNKKVKDGTIIYTPKWQYGWTWPLGLIKVCERRGALGAAANLRQKFGLLQQV